MLKERKKPRWDLKSEVIQNHVNNDRGLTYQSSNGSIRAIYLMDTNHIKNAIGKFERGESENKKGIIPVLKMELQYRSVCEIKEEQNEGK